MKTSARVILVVDLSNQIYRALHSHPELSYDGAYTGGLYGFLSQLATAVSYTRATHVVLCKDSKPYIRSTTYPDYKRIKRTPPDPIVREAYQESERLVLAMAADCGMPVWEVPGFEADDLVGVLVKRRRHRYARIWSLSNDSDLDQLLWCPTFSRYAGTTKVGKTQVPKVITLQTFHQDYPGMDPRQVPLMLALSGTHNDVEGIPQVGKVKSYSAVMFDSAKLAMYRREHGALIERNIGLITLPHPDFPFEESIPPDVDFDLYRLYRYCTRLGITVTPMMSAAFSQLK